MERLTIEYCGEYVPKELCSIDRLGGADDCDLCCEYCKATEEGNEDCRECAINKCFNKLGEYEDLEEQGKMLKLPCAVGDTVYRICPKCNDAHNGSCKNCAWENSCSNQGCTVYGGWKDGQYPMGECTIVPYKVSWNYIPNLLENIGKRVFLTREEAEAALNGGNMRYKCIKEMCLPKCDGDGFEIPNEYGFVTVGSTWERDDRGSIISGDVHLDSINNNPDLGWIEISFEDLEESFVLIK